MTRRVFAPLVLVLTLAAVAVAGGDTIEDLLMDLQVIPMDRQAPKTFRLATPDGRVVTLADVKGPALLYFWATW